MAPYAHKLFFCTHHDSLHLPGSDTFISEPSSSSGAREAKQFRGTSTFRQKTGSCISRVPSLTLGVLKSKHEHDKHHRSIINHNFPTAPDDTVPSMLNMRPRVGARTRYVPCVHAAMGTATGTIPSRWGDRDTIAAQRHRTHYLA